MICPLFASATFGSASCATCGRIRWHSWTFIVAVNGEDEVGHLDWSRSDWYWKAFRSSSIWSRKVFVSVLQASQPKKKKASSNCILIQWITRPCNLWQYIVLYHRISQVLFHSRDIRLDRSSLWLHYSKTWTIRYTWWTVSVPGLKGHRIWEFIFL